MHFVDTNIFLRYLTNDDVTKARKCFTLFQKVKAGEIALTTSEAVIAEVVYLLSSKRVYNLAREKVVTLLRPLLHLSGLKLPYRAMHLRALELYATFTLDYEDALTIAHMERQKITNIYTYDRDFDQISAIRRLEP